MKSPFSKDIYIRLTEDERGFLYTVKWGWLRLDSGQIRPVEQGQISPQIEAPISSRRTFRAVDEDRNVE
jgi:hypothetical protein